MAKRTMGKWNFREPTEDQVAKYRQIQEAISAEIMDIEYKSGALRSGEQTRTKSLPPTVDDTEVNDG